MTPPANFGELPARLVVAHLLIACGCVAVTSAAWLLLGGAFALLVGGVALIVYGLVLTQPAEVT